MLEPEEAHAAHHLTGGLLLYRDPKSLRTPETVCLDCISDLLQAKRPQLSLANNMWIGETPFKLYILTLPELILVSRFHAAAYVVKMYPKKRSACWIPKDQLTSALKGNISSYFMNSEEITHLVDDSHLPPRQGILAAMIAITFIGKQNISMNTLKTLFTVQHVKVVNALHWLIANNKCYSHIQMSSININALPENGVPQELLTTVKYSEDKFHFEEERQGYMPDGEEDEEHWAEDQNNPYEPLCEGSESEEEENTASDTPGKYKN